MPVVSFDDDQPVVDPDQLKMPETAAHRRTVDLIGLAADRLLDAGFRVFRDMNWYPTDGGSPMAPDLMVLPSAAVGPDPTSYRQDRVGGPSPIVVVEVPSASDTFASFRAKAMRCRALGSVVYLVVTDRPHPAVLRLGPGPGEPQPWSGQPVEELGGIRLAFDGDDLVVTMPDGARVRCDADLLAVADQRAAQAEARATQAEKRAAEAEARARALARRLEALGLDPEAGPEPV